MRDITASIPGIVNWLKIRTYSRRRLLKTIDIKYANVGGIDLCLDLYMPSDAEKKPPLLVWIHGGAWMRGSKDSINLGFVEMGFAMASVEFRLSGIAQFPAQIHDIKAAIRYLRFSASDYGYDATRVGILGVSSGGHLAVLAGVTNGKNYYEGVVGEHLDQSSTVHSIVSYFGASNLTTILDQSTPHGLSVRVPALDLFIGGQPEQLPEVARAASPIYHVDSQSPPVFLVHGDQDPQMPINQSHELHSAYKKYGLEVHFEVIHGGYHGGDSFFDARTNTMLFNFLVKHIPFIR
ncbi:MAG: lipase [Gammaproteobacteria bacterium]|nr:lipase [Gammaproteobacteria bacterium]